MFEFFLPLTQAPMTWLLAILTQAPGAAGQSCEMTVYRANEKEESDESILYAVLLILVAALIMLALGVVVGTVMNRPKQQQKQEKSTQTEKLMRMEVKVEELTIESIRDRLRTTDLRLSGSKQQLADRLTENSTW